MILERESTVFESCSTCTFHCFPKAGGKLKENNVCLMKKNVIEEMNVPKRKQEEAAERKRIRES